MFIVFGLYGVLWGKNEELKTSKMVSSSKGVEATSINSIHDEAQSICVTVSVEPDKPNVAN